MITCLVCKKKLDDIDKWEANCKKSPLPSKGHVIDAKDAAVEMNAAVGMD